MFDINGPEFLALIALAVIIFGPEKLPELARKAARLLNYLRNIANDAQGKLRKELGPDFANLNLSDLNPKAMVTSTLLDPVRAEVADVRATVAETAAAARVEEPEEPATSLVVAFDTEAT
jgi:sec-independent protein translocase protein TatB